MKKCKVCGSRPQLSICGGCYEYNKSDSKKLSTYFFRALSVFLSVFFTYVLVWCYVMIPDPLARFFTVVYLIFWVPISIMLIYQSFKTKTK
jgi:hypothetical protein